MSRPGFGFRTAAGSILVAVSVVALGWFHDVNTRALLEANRWVDHTQSLLGALESTLASLTDAETGQRGYFLTGREAYLAPYSAAVPEVGRHLDELRKASADDSEQQQRVAVLADLSREKLRELADSIRLYRDVSPAAASAMIETDNGKRTMDSIRRTADAIRTRARESLRERTERAEGAARRLRIVSLGSAGLVLALLAALLWVIRRDLVGRAEAEAQLRTTLRSIGDAVMATDVDGRITFLNTVCERLTGWTSAEAHGRDVEEVFRIVNEQTRAGVENPVRRVLREGVIVGLANHTVLLSRAGKEIPIADSGAPILDENGKLTGVVLVFRDITEQRRGQVAVERLADVFASSQVAILAENLEGKITDWNAGAQELFGFSAAEMIGRPMHDLAPPGFAEPPTPLDELAKGGTHEIDVRRRTKDGKTMEVAVYLSAIRDSTGRMVGVSRIQRDVTERRQQRDELVQARHRAEEANATKDRFLANLSHELRTPLTPIVASVHRLEQRTDLPEGVSDSLAMVRRNVELEARLIDDLLDLTRIARGKLELHRQPLDLHELLRTVVQSSRSELLAKGLSMSLSLEASEHFGDADGGRLQQVFWNLLRNAIKFTPSGGRVTIVSDNPQPGSIRIRVQDTGKGIQPALLSQIFEPFMQGDTTAARSGTGLGLGLSIARNLVAEHGGSITAESPGLGQGASFVVVLFTTSARPQRLSRTHVATLASGTRQPVSVLVVEDDTDTAEAMRMLLGEAGFDVHVAGGVEEASRVFRDHPADVVVSDIGLPDGSGLEVLAQLRTMRSGLPGIVLSGYGMEHDVSASRASGFAEHFIKPVNFDRLIAAIDRLTEREKKLG